VISWIHSFLLHSTLVYHYVLVSAPVIALGCLDQDVNQRSCLQFPHLYRQGQNNECFTVKVRMGWALNGVYVVGRCTR
jgi:phospholipid-translocating ATPase